jgi:hypothetical protein
MGQPPVGPAEVGCHESAATAKISADTGRMRGCRRMIGLGMCAKFAVDADFIKAEPVSIPNARS